MKFLVDESLSARVARLLVAAGHDAIHVGDLGLLGAADPDVMDAARTAGRVLVSADTDFGELLALGRHTAPSVILLRRVSHRPDQQARMLLASLPDIEDGLAEGAIVVLGQDRLRIRLLPVDKA